MLFKSYPNSFSIVCILFLAAALAACGSAAKSSEPAAPSLETVKALVDKGACGTCHTIPNIEKAVSTAGPEWCDPAHEFQGGEVDLAFLKEAITNPNAEIASGFTANVMPANFGTLFTQEEIDTLARFIATLECEE